MVELEVNKATQVLIVDDHRMVREGLRALLATEDDIEIVGEASSGEEALDRVRELMPDVVVMDLQMPGIGGLEAIRRVKEISPATSIVVLTVDNAELVLLEAIRAGAAGYVLKDASAELLLQSIRLIKEGGTLLPNELLVKALRGVTIRGPRQGPPPEFEQLTPREQEVLLLVARGMGNQEIAESLSLSKVTAKKYVHNILRKLQVSDRTQAALMAVRLGLTD
ncbi:DNA-binding response regulator [bacterium CPR1]|nr:DNA-binding response regulator [bacterium CPR1]